MDVWQYAKIENIELPNLYFAHEREVIDRNGSLLAVTEFVTPGKMKLFEKKQFVFDNRRCNLHWSCYF